MSGIASRAEVADCGSQLRYNSKLLPVFSFSVSTLERFAFEAERQLDHWRLAKDQCSRRTRRLTDSSSKYQGVLMTIIRSSPPRNSLTFKSVARWLYRRYSYQCVCTSSGITTAISRSGLSFFTS